MLKKRPKEEQQKMELVILGDLVPKDHLLRKIAKAIEFDFIYEKVKDLYCSDNGRPAVDPIVLFKMLFIGYLFGIRSERQLVRDIEVNVAYRWFPGFDLTRKVPDAGTISQNRRRRFNQSDICQEIFDEIVFQAIKRGLVDGQTLYSDSTHLKANANKSKFKRELVDKSTRDYIKVCGACELRGQCTQSRNMVKIITRHIWQDSKETINDHRYEIRVKAIYGRRKETVERSFADGKQLHGHRYARFRGLLKVTAQCLLSAACQNMKKIALIVHRKGRRLFFAVFYAPMSLKNAFQAP